MLCNLAMCYESSSSQDKAIEHYLKALSIFTSVNDSLKIFRASSALISRYNQIGDNTKALHYYEMAKNHISQDDLSRQAKLNNRVGILYFSRGDWTVALRYYKQNLPVYKKTNDAYGQAFTNLNIGICFDEMGRVDSARYFLEESLKWYRQANYPSQLALCMQELANFYIGQKEYERARTYLSEAGNILTEIGSNWELIGVKRTTAQLLQKQGKLIESINHAKDGLALSDSLDIFESRGLIEILSDNHADLGQYREAYRYAKLQLTNRDSIFSIENQKIINQLEEQYRAKEKQAQIDAQAVLLGNQRIVNLGIGLVAVLFLALAFLLWRNVQQRKRTNAQLRLLDSAKSRFFANISHELKTPLSLILGPLENAIERSSNKQLSNDLKLAQRNGQKLLTLVNEVMDLSKLESGQLTIKTSKTNLHGLLARIVSAFESLCQIRKIHLHIDYDMPKESIVELDIEKFETIRR